jgi:phosphoribosyl 1,2-cyclic phosphodiesterase
MQAVLWFSLLGSGSSGNALFVRSKSTKLLIDNGLSHREIRKRVESLGEALEDLAGIFITHEHGDHVRGVGILSRKYGIPVYLTEATCAALPLLVGSLHEVHCFEAGETVRVGDIDVESFSVSHDAADPVSFVISCGGVRLGMATEMGHVSELVRRRLAGVHGLVVESNYCPDMLLHGKYPAQVQHRIRSRNGHLSNQSACSLLSDLQHDGLRTVVLVHISANNNTPETVLHMAAGVLKNHPAQIILATQDRPTPLLELFL